ncbi:hypothetical protein FAI41_01400 [Acetobacteraceae bacterium]|nr:hypothetical protein FAI41_01400 [Acetobacteraceae bacterium]
MSNFSKIKTVIKEILRKKARRKKQITYTELSQEVDRRTGEYIDPHSPILARMLGEISTETYNLGQGMLSILVIRKDNSSPGDGFFELAAELGENISKKSPEDDKTKFEIEQFYQVCDFYKSK